MRTKIIYEDNSIIVVHKPAGLATQTAKVGQPDVVSELKKYLANTNRQDTRAQGASAVKNSGVYLGIIHRLDQPVEGLLIFAKDKRAAAALTAQLGQGTLNKQYYAVICGQPSAEEGELVDYLCKEGTGGNTARAQIVAENMAESMDAKRAVLQYRTVKQINTQKFLYTSVSISQASPATLEHTISQKQSMIAGELIFLMDIHIDTGRFHQIRAQMAHAGMPLLGDSKYGTEESTARSRELGVRNVALCAYRLEFTHPVTKKKMSFEIEPEGKIFAMDCE